MKKLLLALPVFLLVAAGCNSSSTTQQTPQTQPTQQAQTTPTPVQQQVTQTPTTAPTSTANSNLKTYTDTEYNFTFQYPSDAQVTTRGQGQKTDAQIKHIVISRGKAEVTVSIATPKSAKAADQACSGGGECISYQPLLCEQNGAKSCLEYDHIPLSGDTQKEAFILDQKTNNKIQMSTSFSLQFNQLSNQNQLTAGGSSGESKAGDALMKQWVDQGKLPKSDYDQTQLLNQIYSSFKFVK